MHFTGQHAAEEIIVVTRPHWIVFFGRTIEAVLLFLLLPVVYALLLAFFPAVLQDPFSGLARLLGIMYLYAVWAFFFLSWAHYWFDVSIVTTERIVKIEQHAIFRREISEFRISRVQDLRVEITGVLATLLKFGNLTIETAGEGPAFVFKRIPHPEKVKDTILHYQGTVSHV